MLCPLPCRFLVEDDNRQAEPAHSLSSLFGFSSELKAEFANAGMMYLVPMSQAAPMGAAMGGMGMAGAGMGGMGMAGMGGMGMMGGAMPMAMGGRGGVMPMGMPIGMLRNDPYSMYDTKVSADCSCRPPCGESSGL